VSSCVGFLALFGVSVQTGVIMLEYINQLRARGYSVLDAVREGAVSRFRPILMTMLVALLGLVPAATSYGIGSDSQRPFCDCDRGRPDGGTLHEHLSSSGALRLVRRSRRLAFMFQLKRILFPIDFSNRCRGAAAYMEA